MHSRPQDGAEVYWCVRLSDDISFVGAGVHLKPLMARVVELHMPSASADSSGRAGSSRVSPSTGSPAESLALVTCPPPQMPAGSISGQRQKDGADPAVSNPGSASAGRSSTAGAHSAAQQFPQRRVQEHPALAAVRNRAAAAVLERFAQKLEGRDPDLSEKGKKPSELSVEGVTVKSEGRRGESEKYALAVEQQVDLLMREARSEDNLSRMFEGWTPWL